MWSLMRAKPWMRCGQRTDPALKGLRWALLKDKSKLSPDQARDLDRLVVQFTTKRTARAWLYREQLRDVLDRRQINIVSALLARWSTNVMRSKVEPMKQVATMIRTHFDGIVAWTRSRQTNGFIEAINGLFQAAKGARIHPIANHENSPLPHRRQT